MWQRNAILLALGLSLSPSAVSLGEEIPGSKRLPAKTNWITCDLAMGRLVVLANRAKQDQPSIERTWPDGTEERFRVSLDRGLASLHYASCGTTEKMTIHVARREQVDFEHSHARSTQEPVRVRFTQEPDQPLRLTIESDAAPPVEYTGESLWHLLIAHPEACRTHLCGLLQTLMPHRNLEAERDELRTRLLAAGSEGGLVTRQAVADLVAQMGDHEFRSRQRASRELRMMGHAALAILDDFEHTTLDSEQRWRVRTLQDSIVANLTDSPDRLVAWLANDESIWRALLNDEDASCRALAEAQLVRLSQPESVPPPSVRRQIDLRLPGDTRSVHQAVAVGDHGLPGHD
jgi:hypothetical protein